MAKLPSRQKPREPTMIDSHNALALPENFVGRDFVMGDLHGEMPVFWSTLDAVGFDRTKDRLFSVGDLIDRGADSIAALRLLRESWFYAVQGNHEQMMVETLIHRINDSAWRQNGGAWYLAEDRDELLELAKLAADRPMILQIGEAFRVVHAEWPCADPIENIVFDREVQNTMRWSRTLHLQYAQFLHNLAAESDGHVLAVTEVEHLAGYIPIQHGVPLTFCGHTSVKHPGLWRSHFLLDSGCGWWPNGPLTIIDVQTPIGIYQHFLKERPSIGATSE